MGLFGWRRRRKGGCVASKAQETAGVDIGAAWVEEEEIVEELIFFGWSEAGIDEAELGDVGESWYIFKTFWVSVGAHAVVELVCSAAAEFPSLQYKGGGKSAEAFDDALENI